MKSLSLVLLTILGALTSLAQPYAVGRSTITIVDEQRSNRAISTDIYYPASVAGNNIAIAGGQEKFPVIVFGHGFVIGTASYKWLGDSLARNGFIAAFPNTEGSISPDHATFGKDLSIVCTKIIAFDADATSPFFGRVLNKGAVGGHSMGGGSSYLAAASGNTTIKALFNFAAAETNPSAIAAAALVNVPSLIISGSRDCIVPPATQLQMFNAVPTGICKAYINLTDALHCHFADNNFTCATGQLFTGCNSSPINPSQVFARTISLLVPFLNYHLKQLCSEGTLFETNFNSTPAVSRLLQCDVIPACGPLAVRLLSFKGRAGATENFISWKTGETKNFSAFELQKSADGQIFETIASIPANAANTYGSEYNAADAFPFSGDNFYRLKMIDLDNSFAYSDIINVRSNFSKVYVSSIFPNPVKDVLQINLNSRSRIQARIQALDFSGKEIFSKLYTITEGNSSILVDAASLKPGIFMLIIKTSSGEVIGMRKLQKL